MHVLHWYPNLFGGGAVSASVAEIADRQHALGARVTIVALERSGAPLYEEVLVDQLSEILTWKPRWSISLGGRRFHELPSRFARKLRSIKPDVVHIHGELNPDNLRVPELFRCPILLGPRGGFHPALMSRGHWLLKRLYLPIAQRRLYSRVSLFDALAPTEVQHIGALVPRARVACILQGGNPRLSHWMESAIPAREHAPDEIRLVCVARLSIQPKGLDFLLGAFAAAKAALPDRRWSLTLVGPDQDGGRAELESRARRLGVGGQVQFAGKLSFAEVWRELVASDLFVMLSRHEGLGTSAVEALLAGKPIVVSEEVGAASFPEIATMPHVFRVPPGSAGAAAAIVEVAKRLPELSAAAREHRETVSAFFSWDRSAKQLLACYADLLSYATESKQRVPDQQRLDPRLPAAAP